MIKLHVLKQLDNSLEVN